MRASHANRLLPLLAGLWLVLTGIPVDADVADGDAGAASVEKVVYHADFADPRRFSAMLTSIRNMVATYESDLRDYDVRIVFVAHGIRFVTEDKLANTPFAEDEALRQRRRELRDRLVSLRDAYGVKLELCGITQKETRLPEDKLIGGVTIVPSGVVRLAELQRQGFAYLKIE